MIGFVKNQPPKKPKSGGGLLLFLLLGIGVVAILPEIIETDKGEIIFVRSGNSKVQKEESSPDNYRTLPKLKIAEDKLKYGFCVYEVKVNVDRGWESNVYSQPRYRYSVYNWGGELDRKKWAISNTRRHTDNLHKHSIALGFAFQHKQLSEEVSSDFCLNNVKQLKQRAFFSICSDNAKEVCDERI